MRKRMRIRVRITPSGLEASMEDSLENATCVEDMNYNDGKSRRRHERKEFKTQGYIEMTLQRGSMNKIVKSLN